MSYPPPPNPYHQPYPQQPYPQQPYPQQPYPQQPYGYPPQQPYGYPPQQPYQPYMQPPVVQQPPPQPQAPQWPVGTFYIKCKLNGLVCDAKGEGKSEGTDVIVWSQKGSKNQQWKFEPDGVIRNVMNGLCMDIKNENYDVICWKYHGKTNQQWMWDGVHLISKMNGKYLDVKGASTKTGADVIVWQANGGKNQEWELIPV